MRHNPLFLALGAQPYPVEGTAASNEIAFVAHPLDATLWELGGMASEGLEHLAYDGHAHDLAHEAEEMGWQVLAESFDELIALLGAEHIDPEFGFPLSSAMPSGSHRARTGSSVSTPAPSMVTMMTLHWEETLESPRRGIRRRSPLTANPTWMSAVRK